MPGRFHNWKYTSHRSAALEDAKSALRQSFAPARPPRPNLLENWLDDFKQAKDLDKAVRDCEGLMNKVVQMWEGPPGGI